MAYSRREDFALPIVNCTEQATVRLDLPSNLPKRPFEHDSVAVQRAGVVLDGVLDALSLCASLKANFAETTECSVDTATVVKLTACAIVCATPSWQDC